MPLSQADDGQSKVLTRPKALQLLGAHIINLLHPLEEQYHPWSAKKFPKLDCPLLRVWDRCSGSQPKANGRMLARSPNQVLDTREARKTSLASHLDHAAWNVPTPYISFTSSASVIKGLVPRRIEKRGNQILTVIDPAVRLEKGLPILDVHAEMNHYSIPDPYNKGSRYYINHYVCLWEVTLDEIVGHYSWEDLSRSANWYEEVIMPAFREHRKAKIDTAPTRVSAFNMSKMMENLPSKFITRRSMYLANCRRHKQAPRSER